MSAYFDKTFQLRFFEMNDFGEASPTTILTLLEETAADHCYSIGHGLYDLKRQDIGWILLSGFMQMERYPIYKEKITIRTWLSTYTTIRGYRENLIYDESGVIIGRARGLWLFFDIDKRRPSNIFEDIMRKWSFREEVCVDHNITRKIKPVLTSEMTRRFSINRFDVDSYDHVNNIRYLAWLMESMPEEVTNHHFLHSIDGRFVSEAQYGDTLVSFTRQDPADSRSFSHSIKTESNDKVCASAETVWKSRTA
ncbi:thioesterase [Balneolales bacterium ANBcel1]|nr:thioesterase [Balneolales bacterium ANBcel1]